MIDALSLLEISTKNREKFLDLKRKDLEKRLKETAKFGLFSLKITSEEIEDEILKELEDNEFNVSKVINDRHYDYIIEWK